MLIQIEPTKGFHDSLATIQAFKHQRSLIRNWVGDRAYRLYK